LGAALLAGLLLTILDHAIPFIMSVGIPRTT
jgi:hypothetical protein